LYDSDATQEYYTAHSPPNHSYTPTGDGGRGYPLDDYQHGHRGTYPHHADGYANDADYRNRSYQDSSGEYRGNYGTDDVYQNGDYYPEDDLEYPNHVGNYPNHQGNYPDNQEEYSPQGDNWEYDDQIGQYYDKRDAGYGVVPGSTVDDEGRRVYRDRDEYDRTSFQQNSSFDTYGDEEHPKRGGYYSQIPPVECLHDKYDQKEEYDDQPMFDRGKIGDKNRYETVTRTYDSGRTYTTDLVEGVYEEDRCNVRFDQRGAGVDSLREYNSFSFEEDRAACDGLERVDTVGGSMGFEIGKDQGGAGFPVVADSLKDSGYQTYDRKGSAIAVLGPVDPYEVNTSLGYPKSSVGVNVQTCTATIESKNDYLLKTNVLDVDSKRRTATKSEAEFDQKRSPKIMEVSRDSGVEVPPRSSLQQSSFSSWGSAADSQASNIPVGDDRLRASFDAHSLSTNAQQQRQIDAPRFYEQSASTTKINEPYDLNVHRHPTEVLPTAGAREPVFSPTSPPGEFIGEPDKSATVPLELRGTNLTGYIWHA